MDCMVIVEPEEELTILLLDLFSTSKVFRDMVSSKLSETDADEVLEKYRAKLEKAFNRIQSFSLASCKSIVADYESIASDKAHVAIINYWFSYYAAEFSATYGDIDSGFYNSLTRAGLKAIEYSSSNREFYEEWYDYFNDLISLCGHFGWGVQEDLKRAFTDVELKWIDEDEGCDEEPSEESGL